MRNPRERKLYLQLTNPGLRMISENLRARQRGFVQFVQGEMRLEGKRDRLQNQYIESPNWQ
jgi:hypothetical protein